MFASHRPRVFRSRLGCCICGAKSSSSRFTSSSKYELLFSGCFQLNEKRQGEICNACVLLVKRWKKLPPGSSKNWKHVRKEMSCFHFESSAVCAAVGPLYKIWAHYFVFPSQVVDSKATVKRCTKPRRSSRTLNADNGSEMTSSVNGRATSGRNGEQENRGLYGLLFITSWWHFSLLKHFFLGVSCWQSSYVSREGLNGIVCSFESNKIYISLSLRLIGGWIN